MEIYQEFVLISILSILLASLIGRLFAIPDDDADREKIADDAQGNDSLRSGLTDAKCEGDDNRFKEIDSVRSDDDDDVAEMDICDLDEHKEEGSGEVSEGKVQERSGEFETVGVEDCCASGICRSKESEFVEKEKFDFETVESREEETVLISGVDEKERFETVIVGDMSARDVCELKGSENVEEKNFDRGEEIDEKIEVVLEEEAECITEVAKRANSEEGNLLSEDDEWEGIERTEMQRRFHEAAAYVGSENAASALSSLSANDQMQLYGLHKVATEGPCYEPRPMALKVAARGKWNAWQKLGNMNPDVAMEQYMNLLSEKIPGWMVEKPEGDVGHHAKGEILETTSSGKCLANLCLRINSQPSPETKREESTSCIDMVVESAALERTNQGSDEPVAAYR